MDISKCVEESCLQFFRVEDTTYKVFVCSNMETESILQGEVMMAMRITYKREWMDIWNWAWSVVASFSVEVSTTNGYG